MLEQIVEPTLVIDKNKCLSNISKMASKAAANKLIFRPHFKTHQSKEIGEWYRKFGVDKITVSSVSMAEFFSKANWKDITVAFPLNPREIGRINAIAQDVILGLTIENNDAIELVSEKLKRSVNIYIKIDTGYNRTGIWYKDFHKINDLLEKLKQTKLMTFMGFIIHAGHTYSCTSKDDIINVHTDSLHKIDLLKKHYSEEYPDLILSYGDTPSCSVADDFQGIDEIRPGNFVYYDLMQHEIGSCTINDIAVAVACPVVAIHPTRNQIILHGGAVHLSKEFLTFSGRKVWGVAAVLKSNSWNIPDKENMLIGISQEHGILEVKNSVALLKHKVGDLILIIPVHSCLSANLLRDPVII